MSKLLIMVYYLRYRFFKRNIVYNSTLYISNCQYALKMLFIEHKEHLNFLSIHLLQGSQQTIGRCNYTTIYFMIHLIIANKHKRYKTLNINKLYEQHTKLTHH